MFAAAFEYFLSNPVNEVDLKKFNDHCGVGVVVTPEQIEEAVQEVINKHKSELQEKRYRFNTGPLMLEVRQKLKWADGKQVKNEVDVQVSDSSMSEHVLTRLNAY